MKSMWGHGKEVATCKLGQRLQEKANLLMLWSGTSSFQNCEKIDFCWVSRRPPRQPCPQSVVVCYGNSSKGIQGRVAKFFSNSLSWGDGDTKLSSVGASAGSMDEFTEPPPPARFPEQHAFSGKLISLSKEMQSVMEVSMRNQSCIPEIKQRFQDASSLTTFWEIQFWGMWKSTFTFTFRRGIGLYFSFCLVFIWFR